MKKLTTILSSLTLVICLTGAARATQIKFDLDGGGVGGSSVTVNESSQIGTHTGTLVGNQLLVDYEDIKAVGLGKAVTDHALITNRNGEGAPVPESSNMVLIGAGLLGLAIYSKRKMNKDA